VVVVLWLFVLLSVLPAGAALALLWLAVRFFGSRPRWAAVCSRCGAPWRGARRVRRGLWVGGRCSRGCRPVPWLPAPRLLWVRAGVWPSPAARLWRRLRARLGCARLRR
jgi:hypothetical protein